MKKSFTMVEMLVVIAVIGILAGILVPVLGNATKKARVTQARADINNLMTAIKNFESTYNALPCDYSDSHAKHIYDTTGKKGFAKEENYLFWHEYNKDNDAKKYDVLMQELSQVDIVGESAASSVRNWISDGSEHRNSRGLKLLEVNQDFPEKGFVDPWGNRYAIIMNDGYAKNGIIFKRDKSLKLKSEADNSKKLVGDVFIYSFGPNMIDDYGITPEENAETTANIGRDFDDINSWAVQ